MKQFGIISLWLMALPIFAKPYVEGTIKGGLGNQMFQIAATSALAWDNGAKPIFPSLKENSRPARHTLHRVDRQKPKKTPSTHWQEPSYAFTEIPYSPNMKLTGYFQSEKYFAKYRKRLLKLFAPHPKDLKHIQKKYKKIINSSKSVGVQIRYYRREDPTGAIYPQYGSEYLEKAMSLFPPDSRFIVSTDNIDFAKKVMPKWARHVTYLKGEPDYIDFHLLSLCRHNIITNSSFGWWSAYLNTNPNKIVVCPSHWVNGLDYRDVIPNRWIGLTADPEN